MFTSTTRISLIKTDKQTDKKMGHLTLNQSLTAVTEYLVIDQKVRQKLMLSVCLLLLYTYALTLRPI